MPLCWRAKHDHDVSYCCFLQNLTFCKMVSRILKRRLCRVSSWEGAEGEGAPLSVVDWLFPCVLACCKIWFNIRLSVHPPNKITKKNKPNPNSMKPLDSRTSPSSSRVLLTMWSSMSWLETKEEATAGVVWDEMTARAVARTESRRKSSFRLLFVVNNQK